MKSQAGRVEHSPSVRWPVRSLLRRAALLGFAALLVGAPGCADDEAVVREGPATGPAPDELLSDEPVAPTPLPDPAAGDPAPPAGPAEVRPPERMDRPPPALPGAPIPAAEASQPAGLVYGVAEIEVDEELFAPAQHLYAALDREGRRVAGPELIDRSGRFYFQDVPPGRYELVILTLSRSPQPIHRTTVTVRSDGEVELPRVQIPLAAVERAPRR